MEEDPLLTPRTDLFGGTRGMRRRRPGSVWGPGLALLGLGAVVFPILLFLLTKL